ncbi:MAG TPA: ATPase domain-containing protein, partial [Nakamurella sp.]
STGIDRLDHMLGGGVYRGSTVLVSGGSGTGKTSLAGHLANASCARGERVLFVSFEESAEQLLRNMRSIGLDLHRWVEAGLLRLWAVRPAAFGLVEQLVQLHRRLDEFMPSMAVLDAMAGLNHLGTSTSVSSTIASQIDMMKGRGVTAVLTSLTHYGQGESSALAVSSLMDTWLLLRNTELDGERNRLLSVIKSRGSAHSNQIREFVLTDQGAELLDVYIGPRGVLTGSARMAQLADERAAAAGRGAQFQRRRQALARRTAQVEQQITVLRDDLATERDELDQLIEQDVAAGEGRDADREMMATHRWADPGTTKDPEPDRSWTPAECRAGSPPGPPTTLMGSTSICGCTSPVRARSRSSRSRTSAGCATDTSPAGTASRSSTCWRPRNWHAARGSSRCRRWSAGSHCRFAPSSVTCPIPTGSSSGCN